MQTSMYGEVELDSFKCGRCCQTVNERWSYNRTLASMAICTACHVELTDRNIAVDDEGRFVMNEQLQTEIWNNQLRSPLR